MHTGEGHWYCLHCHRATELNLDREMNVCGHCGSVLVKYVKEHGERMSKERLHELTSAMRAAIEDEGLRMKD